MRATCAPTSSRTAASRRWMRSASPGRTRGCRPPRECEALGRPRRALDAARKHRHLLLRLLVAPDAGHLDAAPPCRERIGVATGRLQRLAQQLPRRRIARIEHGGAREMLDGGGRLPVLEALVAERIAQQRAIL